MKLLERVAVVIPVHNEADSLAWVLQRLQLHLPGATIVVVDSGCTDDSPSIAVNHGAEVVKANERGYWSALQSGYRALLDRDLEAIVQLDGDGQHNPADAPRLLAKLENADWVVGSRIERSALSRRIGRRVFELILSVNGIQTSDPSSGYWAFRPNLLPRLLDYPYGTADLAVRLHLAGISTDSCPVLMEERKHGRSMHNGIQGPVNFLRSLADAYRVISSR